MDPCDPATLSKGAPSFPRVQQHVGENRTPGKSKAGKAKGKGKKTQEDDRPTAPVRKLWYEARSPEGYTYYWHIETNGACTFVIFLFFCLSAIFFPQTILASYFLTVVFIATFILFKIYIILYISIFVRSFNLLFIYNLHIYLFIIFLCFIYNINYVYLKYHFIEKDFYISVNYDYKFVIGYFSLM